MARLYERTRESVPGWVGDAADILVTIAIIASVLAAASLLYQNHKRADEARILALQNVQIAHEANVRLCRSQNELRRQLVIILAEMGATRAQTLRIHPNVNCERLP